MLMMLSAGVLAMATASPQEVARPAFEVVRLGDGQLSCAALVSEINSLSSEMQSVQERMTQRSADMTRAAIGRVGSGGAGPGGTALTLGGMAASFVPGADMVMGTVTALAGPALAARETSQMLEEVDEITSQGLSLGPISQRLEHLSAISRERRC